MSRPSRTHESHQTSSARPSRTPSAPSDGSSGPSRVSSPKGSGRSANESRVSDVRTKSLRGFADATRELAARRHAVGAAVLGRVAVWQQGISTVMRGRVTFEKETADALRGWFCAPAGPENAGMEGGSGGFDGGSPEGSEAPAAPWICFVAASEESENATALGGRLFALTDSFFGGPAYSGGRAGKAEAHHQLDEWAVY